ncbi:MAG: HlyC/CorC family transporter [Gemmatimonadaceae bacterium]|nr:HlyC/CorC family transporter [Gemmatimonadaceae bacterium]
MSRLLAIVALLALNAFFVAVEFALVRARRSRLEAMVRGGDQFARFALTATSRRNLTRVLSAGQLGITLASLGLGWVAEGALGHFLEGWFEGLPLPLEPAVRIGIGAAVAITIVTYLHVVFGELAPRALSLNYPEHFAKWLAPPILAFTWVTWPFIWLLNGSSNLLLRAFGQHEVSEEEAPHSPEEIRLLVERASEGGALPVSDAEILGGVFQFSEKNAREVMTPRTKIVAIPLEATLDEAVAEVVEAGFSRYPVYRETLDDIVGMVHSKDLLRILRKPPADFTLQQIVRTVHVVPGSREVEEVLSDFKRRKEHLAIVLDEFGGTAGMVTMEDLLEEIVGEILDEYDDPLTTSFKTQTADGTRVIRGDANIGEINEELGLTIPDEDYTTVGGYVFGLLGRLPVSGDKATGAGAQFTVLEMDGRRIRALSVQPVAPSEG